LAAAVTVEPASPEANAALGFYYRTHGRASAAVAYFERARAAAPGAAPYRVLLADSYIESGRYREALGELDAVDEPAHRAKALALRAKAYYNLGDREAAAAAARRALELEPDLAEAKAFLTEP
jgi:tetratricopeptide (TPR) repeat protein